MKNFCFALGLISLFVWQQGEESGCGCDTSSFFEQKYEWYMEVGPTAVVRYKIPCGGGDFIDNPLIFTNDDGWIVSSAKNDDLDGDGGKDFQISHRAGDTHTNLSTCGGSSSFLTAPQ